MGRRLFIFVTAVSFLLLVFVLTLDVRSRHPYQPLDRQGKPISEDRAVEAQLERSLPEVRFDGVGLSDVMDFLVDVTGASIEVDWKKIDAAGISRNTPISASEINEPFYVALSQIVDSAGLAFSVEDGVIHISTRGQIRHGFSRYRTGWPWPSEGDLQAPTTLAVYMRWDHPAPFDMGGHRKHEPPPPDSDAFEDALETIGKRAGVSMTVQWDAIEPLGISKYMAVDRQPGGYSRDWIGSFLRYGNADGTVQYQLRDSCVTIAPQEWFDSQEEPICRAVWTGLGFVLILWLIILLLLVHRRRRLGAFWFATVLLLGGIIALHFWKLGTSSVQWRGPIHHYTVAINENQTLEFRKRPLALPDGPILPGMWLGVPQNLFSHALLKVQRMGLVRSELSITTPFPALAGVLAALPFFWCISVLRRRVVRIHRQWRGACLGCGYDLRATSGRCPECGREIGLQRRTPGF